MEVNIESIGIEDGHYEKEIKVISIEMSAAETALRLQLASGIKSGDMRVLVAGDDHSTKNLVAAFKQVVMIEPQEDEPSQHWYPESGKKVAQWKKETYGRLHK